MNWYWFIIVPAVLTNCYNLKCRDFSNRSRSALPKPLALKGNYKVVVRRTNWLDNVTSLITESHIANETRFTVISRLNGTTHIVLGNRNYIYNENSCTSLPDAAAAPPIYLQPELTESCNITGISVAELVASFLHFNFNFAHEENVTEEGGIAAVSWLGCGKNNGKITQLEVVYAGNHSQHSYSSTVKNPYILSFHLSAFNTTSETLIGYDSAEITQLEMLAEDSDAHLKTELPEGMYCNGFPEAKRPVIFPNKFEMSFDYTDVDGKTVHDIDMYYNGDERIFWMHLNARTGKDIPFIGNARLPEGVTDIHVIHDFQYGLQYLLDGENNVCLSVSAIDENFGNVRVVNVSTKEIDLKKPTQLFLNINGSVFYDAGKRIVNNIPLEVYVTQVNSSSTMSKIIEMLYTTENWVVGTAVAPFLYSIIQYHKNESHKAVKSIIRLHSFRNSSQAGISQTSIPIYPCLKLVEDSYVYINIKNTTLKDLESFGIGRVREGLRGAVARVANVSMLRISNFFFKQIQENVIAFFVIGEASSVKPANTWNRSSEISAESAVNLLNATLKEKDIKFPLFIGHRSVMLSLSKASLGIIPSIWPPLPAPAFRGYTGGSMFVLGFFMLLLGALLAVTVVYLIWKRQRFSGLAYQVFE